MQKATLEHRVAISKLILERTERYIEAYAINMDAEENGTLYCADIMYNLTAMSKFMHTGNTADLLDALTRQDTYVREWYYVVFKYAQDHKLAEDVYLI